VRWIDIVFLVTVLVSFFLIGVLHGFIHDWLEEHPITRRQKKRAASDRLFAAIHVYHFYTNWPGTNEREEARLILNQRIQEYDVLQDGKE
jgi:hypothetical protein